MKSLIGYNSFINKNSNLTESELLNDEYTMDINESADTQKTLMQFVHNFMYNKLLQRILGSSNKNLDTVIQGSLPAFDVEASEIFKPIWSKIEKYTNPNSNDVKSLILKNMQNEFQIDKTTLETLSISDVTIGSNLQSTLDELKSTKNIFKIIFDGKLVSTFNRLGLYDKMSVPQQDVLKKIDNKRSFIIPYRDKFRESLNEDFSLGLPKKVLDAYAMSPGFKEDKSRKSPITPEKIGFYLTADIAGAGYAYYVAGLAKVISGKFNKNAEVVNKISNQPQKSTQRTSASSTETTRSEFKPDYLSNFGY